MELLILLVVALGAFMAFAAGVALLVIYLRADRAPAGPASAHFPGGPPCPRCGTVNPPGATVCVRCGAPLPARPARPAMPPAPPPAPVSQPRPTPPAAPVYAPGTVRPADMPRAWLEGTAGAAGGQRFWLQKADTLVGRSTVCDVQIPDPKVSRRHFMIRFAQGAFFLQDQQSAQGTWINGERVLAQRLHNGDRITVGDTVLIFRVEG